jgi:hypothetical protein
MKELKCFKKTPRQSMEHHVMMWLLVPCVNIKGMDSRVIDWKIQQ